MKISRYLLGFCIIFCGPKVFSQAPPKFTSSEIYLRIKKLKVLGSVLYVAAHPDDENTRLLAWLSKDQLVRTGYLSVTRGDGGQNLIGDEQGIELGLIRTQELLAARRIDGAEQFFTRAFDFGYSKSTDEALKIWGREKILSDMVWVIRNFQPDVMITRFPGDSRAGHGHHSASAVLAKEAFSAAADPKAFPEQFQYGVKPWQAKRIVWNGYNFDNDAVVQKDKINTDVGGYNPVLGRSYGELAAESRSQHKSQGFGVPSSRGSVIENFTNVGGSSTSVSLTDGVDMSWGRIGEAGITKLIDDILKNYSLANPSLSVPSLVALYKKIFTLPDSHWKPIKLQEVKEIIAACNGIWMEAFTGDRFAVKGSNLTVNFSVNDRQGGHVQLKRITIPGFDSSMNVTAVENKNINFSHRIIVPDSIAISQPYWLKEKMSAGSFNVDDQTQIGAAASEPSFKVVFQYDIDGTTFDFTRPVMYKFTDPVKGEVYQPLVVVPAAGKTSSVGTLTHIHYDHIPDIYYFKKDSQKIVLHNVKTAGKKIGYIEGAGDKMPAALALMGYDVTVLKQKDMTPEYLSSFDAIITGVRAYNVHPELADQNDVLNDYIKNGGNLIVQYNTNNNNGPATGMGPYAFNISRNRVTDENSPVKFLLPNDPVLNYPNKITQSDFTDWIQERGIYFSDKYDAAFKTPLAMNDPGEDDQKGSLLIADYGKGKFVYTSLVFFRELPAGIEGAYRLFANIIALNQPKTAK
ncbi:MAG: PIG-L family deacetylase [Flavitalea sp.]